MAGPLTAFKPPLVFSRAIVSALGDYFFDPRMLWKEDADFDQRVRRAGIRIVGIDGCGLEMSAADASHFEWFAEFYDCPAGDRPCAALATVELVSDPLRLVCGRAEASRSVAKLADADILSRGEGDACQRCAIVFQINNCTKRRKIQLLSQ